MLSGARNHGGAACAAGLEAGEQDRIFGIGSIMLQTTYSTRPPVAMPLADMITLAMGLAVKALDSSPVCT